MKMLRSVALLAAVCAVPGFAAGLDAEGAKQVLDAKWQSLKPQGQDRTVLFQDVKVLSNSGTSVQVQVTALVRDYDKGYPANKYYGQTCVGTYKAQPYTISSRAGKWEVDGAMNPREFATCKANPAAGISSMPVESLRGKPAGNAAVAAAPAAVRSGGVVQGAYECWNFNRAQLLLNLTIRAGNQYLDSAGKTGSFAVNAPDGRMSFKGGIWDGGLPAKTYAVYYEPQGRPTISIRGADGGEAAFCQIK